MSGTITMTGEEYDAMAGELDRVSRELSCLQSVIAEPDELNAEPASDYETLRRQYLSLRLLTNSALARNRYLCRRDDRDMRAALSVNAANVSAERDTNAMLTDLLEKAEAERDALHAEAKALRAEIEELDSLRNRQSDLLSQTAIALRGPEPALTRYSHADIPSRVKTVVAELEAARGLLRELRAFTLDHDDGRAGVLRGQIDAFLTATTSPDVPDHIAEASRMAEQGERQEAVGHVYTMQPCFPGEPMRAHAQLHVALPAGTKLYAEPQLGPDVRGLVEALELWLADYDKVAANPDFEPFPHIAEFVDKSRTALATYHQDTQPCTTP